MQMGLSPHDSRFFLRHSAHRRLAASAIRLRPSAEIFRRRWRAGRAESEETLLVIGAVSPRDSSGKALRIAWRSAFNSASRACAPMNARWRMSTKFSEFRGLGIESVSECGDSLSCPHSMSPANRSWPCVARVCKSAAMLFHVVHRAALYPSGAREMPRVGGDPPLSTQRIEFGPRVLASPTAFRSSPPP
jgi:hypothetical protein